MTSTLFLCKTISCNFALGSNLLASYRHSLCPRLLPWGPSPPFFNNCLLFPCSGCLSLYNCAALSSASPPRDASAVFSPTLLPPRGPSIVSPKLTVHINTSDKMVLPPWELGMRHFCYHKAHFQGHVLHVDRLNSLQQWYYFGRLFGREFLYRRNHFSFSSLLQVSITDQFAQVHGHRTHSLVTRSFWSSL